MPRTARASVGNLCYHILKRGNALRRVFFKDGDYQAFLTTTSAWPDPTARPAKSPPSRGGTGSAARDVLLTFGGPIRAVPFPGASLPCPQPENAFLCNVRELARLHSLRHKCLPSRMLRLSAPRRPVVNGTHSTICTAICTETLGHLGGAGNKTYRQNAMGPYPLALMLA